jgi:anti-sigma B factor antagonist
MIPPPTPRPSSPEPGRFRWRRHDIDATVVRVALTGELDAAAAGTLDQILRSVHAEGAVAVIDLDELTSIDTASARMLRAAASRARLQGRRLVAVNARPDVQRALKRTGIARELKLVDTVTDPRTPTTPPSAPLSSIATTDGSPPTPSTPG